MSVTPRGSRSALKAFTWLFASLSLVALMSPPGATHDEWYHATSIWCVQGVRLPYCEEVGNDDEGQFTARTNLDPVNCQRPEQEPLLCPPNQESETRFRVNSDQYPSGFYRAMSIALVPNIEVSFVLIRLLSTFIICCGVLGAVWMVPQKHRAVIFLTILTTFSGTGFYLFSSLNPSSWTSIGAGIGWIPVHAAITSNSELRLKRAGMASVGGTLILMGCVSRWDGIPFALFAVVLAVFHATWTLAPTRRKGILMVTIGACCVCVVSVSVFAKLFMNLDLRILFRYSSDQPNNFVFLTERLLEGLPNALKALGTVPTMDRILLPSIVFVCSLALLAVVVSASLNREDRLQSFVSLVIVAVIGLVIAAQVALVDDRDTGDMEPRYVYPLLIILVSWWYLSASSESLMKIGKRSREASLVVCGVFGLTSFSITERFVDRQSFGLRYLPEGPDQWWWSWLPFGPNIVVALAPLFLWFSLRNLDQLVFRTIRAETSI